MTIAMTAAMIMADHRHRHGHRVGRLVRLDGPIGQPAPDFVLPAVVGSNVRLSEFRGQPVMISFWSSRCSPCAAQLDGLDRYYGTYRSSGPGRAGRQRG